MHSFYKEQNCCKYCNKSQCKQNELFNIINKIGKDNINNICFFCDGNNDICLAKALNENDILFPRENSSIFRKIFNNQTEPLKCKIISWNNAMDTINIFK